MGTARERKSGSISIYFMLHKGRPDAPISQNDSVEKAYK